MSGIAVNNARSSDSEACNSSSARLRVVTSRKFHTLPTDFPLTRCGRESRSKTRPSLNSRTSKLSASGLSYNSLTLLMKSSGLTNCSWTKASAWLSSRLATMVSGIPHISKNLRLKLLIFPAWSTTMMPSMVESSVASSKESVVSNF